MDLVLASLCCQDQPLSDFEVVVVDDGSTDGLKGVIDRYTDRLCLKYHSIEHCGERARLRNLGSEISSAEVLLFVDSDMVASRNLVSSHLKNVESDSLKVSLGLRKCLIDYDKAFLDARMVEEGLGYIEDLPAINDERTLVLEFMDRECLQPRNTWPLVFSHNFAVWKKTFLQAGKFDSIFSKNWGVEDVELGFRLYKIGCDIRINEEAMSYHLFHPTNTHNKIVQLRTNLDLFYRKFPEFEVELFCEEYKIWGREYNLVRKAVLEKRHLVEGVIIREPQVGYSPGETLGMGIDPSCFPPGRTPKWLLLPGQEPVAAGQLDLIGIRTTFKDKEFQTCFVSSLFGSINSSLLEKILAEAGRIARQVLICDAAGNLSDSSPREVVEAPTSKRRDSPGRRLMFVYGSYTGQTAPYMRHNYLKLAQSMQDRGWQVSVQYDFDPFRELPKQAGFFTSKDTGFCRQVESLFQVDLSFFEEEIPCVMDPRIAKFTQTAIGNRICWDRFEYLNEEKKFQKEFAQHFQKFIPQTERDASLVKGPKFRGVVPIGIDAKKIRGYMAETPPLTAEKPFRFLWVGPFAYHNHGFSELLRAFLRAFRGGEDVELMVVHSSNTMTLIKDIYLNKSSEHLIAEYIRLMNLKYADYEAQAWSGVEDRRIKCLKGDISEDEILALLAEADCLIDTSGGFEVSPVALSSLAMGKKPIVINQPAYQDYFGTEDCLLAPGVPVSGVILEPIPELIWPGQRADFRYTRFIKAQEKILADVLGQAYRNRSLIKWSEARRKAFCDNFTWEKSAAKLESLID
jgi:glycosyltransferase involved in cell wall biosynthesis